MSSILGNGDFEISPAPSPSSPPSISPWSCSGIDAFTCGINGKIKGQSSESGSQFLYAVNEQVLTQSVKTQPDQIYNLSYFAYAWNVNTSSAAAGWDTAFQNQTFAQTSSQDFSFAFNGLPSAQWPFFQHQVNASGSDQLSFSTHNNTVFFIDNVKLVCVTCPQKNASSSLGVIFGGIIGALFALGLLFLAAFYGYRTRRHKTGLSDLEAASEGKARTSMSTYHGSATSEVAAAAPPYEIVYDVGRSNLKRGPSAPGAGGTTARNTSNLQQNLNHTYRPGLPELQSIEIPDSYPTFQNYAPEAR